MFKMLKITIKIFYLSLAILMVVRVILKVQGVDPFDSSFRQFILLIYGYTDFFLAPITTVLLKLKPVMPAFAQGYFPSFHIIQTHGTFEIAILLALFIYTMLGYLLEMLFEHLVDYEKAFVNVAKGFSGSTKASTSDNKLKRIKASAEAANIKATKEDSLKNVYNLIIRRLDREKTELVNKNIALEKEIITDTLTGLKTRKYLDERLKYEFNTAKVRKSALSIIMIDIDHFKRINDNCGHQVGDMVLKEISKVVIESCTIMNNIVAARYGGEEITIICPKLQMQDAISFAEEIRKDVECSVILNKDRTPPITISAGIATFCGKEAIRSHDELVRLADAALYEAKKGGRNQVKVYTGD